MNYGLFDQILALSAIRILVSKKGTLGIIQQSAKTGLPRFACFFQAPI